MKSRDPATMAPAERFAEVAEILAAGCQRFFAAECKARQQAQNSANGLDASAARTAACGSQVQRPKSQEPSR